jgi:hypothetical protein
MASENELCCLSGPAVCVAASSLRRRPSVLSLSCFRRLDVGIKFKCMAEGVGGKFDLKQMPQNLQPTRRFLQEVAANRVVDFYMVGTTFSRQTPPVMAIIPIRVLCELSFEHTVSVSGVKCWPLVPLILPALSCRLSCITSDMQNLRKKQRVQLNDDGDVSDGSDADSPNTTESAIRRNASDDHVEGIPSSQISFSQDEDQRLGFLDKSGALNQVMGSQSLLSQEIEGLSQTQSSLLLDPATARVMGLLTQEDTLPSQLSVTNSQLSCLMDAAQALEDQEAIATNDPLEEHEELLLAMEAATTSYRRSARRSTSAFSAHEHKSLHPNAAKALGFTLESFSRQKARSLSPQKKRKHEREQEHKKSQGMAQQAAELAAQVIDSPQVAKQLLLTMALVRINPRSAPTTWPQRGSAIPEGFFWGTYPPLETVLRQHMREYYDLSTKMCQSKDQQHFNNVLVIKIRSEASKYGWIFGSRFTDKILRDRIRCFFKTHIQNSKKRLRTMVKNPTKKANAKALVKHLDLIQTYSEMEPGDEPVDDFLGDAKKLPAPRKNEMNDAVDQEAVNSVMSLGLLTSEGTVGV